MQISKKAKRILLLVLVWAFFTGGVLMCRFLFTQSTITALFNYRMNKIEKSDENIDMVFVGGSRTYRSFDPEVFDEVLGIKNTTNNGSPAQRPVLSYYLFRQIADKNDLKYVVIGSTYNGMIYEQGAHDMMFGLERLSPIDKFKCSISQYGINKGVQVISGKADFLNNMQIETAGKNIIAKYLTSKGINNDETSYVPGNGYKGTYTPVSEGSISYNYDSEKDYFDESKAIPKQFEYFDKIVQECKEKNIKVFLVTGPSTLMNIYNINEYQAAVDFYTDYAEENGIKYYNLNYLKNREKLLGDDKFIDRLHVSYDGGQVASRYCAQIIKDELEGKDTSKYFYKNLEELKRDVHRIPACAIAVSSDAPKYIVRASSYHNEWVTPQYRLSAITEDGKTLYLSGWSKKDKWVIPQQKVKGYKNIKVEAKTGEKGEPFAYATWKIKKED